MREFDYVFGIGPGKSGTHSLWFALEALGVSTIHLGNAGFVNGGDKVLSKRMLANTANSRPILQGVDEARAYVDWPIHSLVPELDAQHPNALFVLTYRNPDDIALSWCRMCHAQGVHLPPDYYSKLEEARLIYHNAFKHFSGRPDKLLVLDTAVSGTANMLKLADFIGAPEPTMDWPHEFNHRDWYRAQKHGKS